jgi:FG-GAP-like repeat
MRSGILSLALLAPVPAAGEWAVTSAEFTEPTTRYDHGVLGDAVEYGAMRVFVTDSAGKRGRAHTDIVLAPSRVFEDLAPRLADLDGDGINEIIVVETDLAQGGSLAVYSAYGLVARTPFLGQPHRWLAPVGAADLDGDGRVEIAYIETPHLGRVLKLVRLSGDDLVPVVQLGGLTNHRIGDGFIQGGIADCGQGPVIVTADADWTHVMVTRFDGTMLSTKAVAPYTGPQSLDPTTICP